MWSKFANQNSEKMQKKVVWRLYTGILRVQMSIVHVANAIRRKQ